MKNTDLFEALNDLPEDMLASAESHSRRTTDRPSRQSWFAEHNGLVAAAASVVVALSTLTVLLWAPWSHTQPPAPPPATGGVADGEIPGPPVDQEPNGASTGGETELMTDPGNTDERADDAVPVETIPRDVPYLRLGELAVVPNLTLPSGLWIDENGEWTDADVEIDMEGFLKASPTLLMAVGDDLRLTLYEAEYTVGRAELYHRQEDGDLAMEWQGDFDGPRWTEWVDGSERMLNEGVYYLLLSFSMYGDTRDGMTEHWEQLAAVRLVVGNPSTEQPPEDETTPTEVEPPVPSDQAPADTSRLAELLTSSDRQNGWWELPDTRALVATLIEGQIAYTPADGDMTVTETMAPIYQFMEMKNAAVLHGTADDLIHMTFNLPSDLKADECTLRYILYDQTGANVLLSTDNERNFHMMLADFFNGREFVIEKYVLEVSITRTTDAGDGSRTETEYGALTHLVVWQGNGSMQYGLTEGEIISVPSGSEASLTVKGIWNGAATAVYTDQLSPSIWLIHTASDWDYKCSVLVSAVEEHRVVRNGDSFSWGVLLPDTLADGVYGIYADGYGGSGIKLGELTVGGDISTTYTDTSVSGVDELGDAAFWWELPDGRCIAAAKCYGDVMQFDKDGNLVCGSANSPIEQLSELDVIPTLVLSRTGVGMETETGYLPDMVFHAEENSGFERQGRYLLLSEEGLVLDSIGVYAAGVYYVQVDLVKYGETIGDMTEQYNLHILLRVVVK